MQKRSEKEQAVTELHEKFLKATVAIVAEPKDIDVETITALRKKFRGGKIEYKVVKNTLAKRALKGTKAEGLTDLFNGPSAIIFGYEDPISPAKFVQDFIREKKDKLVVRGAVVDGAKVDAAGVEALSKMPGLQELRAIMLGMFMRPAQQLACVISQPSTSIARVIDAKREADSKKA